MVVDFASLNKSKHTISFAGLGPKWNAKCRFRALLTASGQVFRKSLSWDFVNSLWVSFGVAAHAGLYEVRIYNIISAPSSWFMIACSDASNWLYENPIKAMCLAAGCGALGGGSFAAYYAANGYCVIWWLFTGCACGGWGMLSSTVMGTVIGGGGGALLVAMVGVSIKVYNESYATEKAPADLKKINDMVDNLNKLPDADFARQLEEIMAGTDALCSIVPATEDRVCVVCLEEGQDVISPVRATRCKGPHFLCKTCWARCVTEWSDKCPVCLA